MLTPWLRPCSEDRGREAPKENLSQKNKHCSCYSSSLCRVWTDLALIEKSIQTDYKLKTNSVDSAVKKSSLTQHQVNIFHIKFVSPSEQSHISEVFIILITHLCALSNMFFNKFSSHYSLTLDRFCPQCGTCRSRVFPPWRLGIPTMSLTYVLPVITYIYNQDTEIGRAHV